MYGDLVVVSPWVIQRVWPEPISQHHSLPVLVELGIFGGHFVRGGHPNTGSFRSTAPSDAHAVDNNWRPRYAIATTAATIVRAADWIHDAAALGPQTRALCPARLLQQLKAHVGFL